MQVSPFDQRTMHMATTPLEVLVGTQMAAVIQLLDIETIKDFAAIACQDAENTLAPLQLSPGDDKRVTPNAGMGVMAKNGTTEILSSNKVTQLLIACQQVV